MANEIGYQTGGNLLGWDTLSGDSHETNPDLAWPNIIDVVDKMRREDSQVTSVLRAVTMPIRSATWQVDPAGAKPEIAKQIARDLGLALKGETFEAPRRTRGRFSFSEHLRLALLMLPYGHSCFEQVFPYEDGHFHLRKLAWRPPRTISEFKVARDGGLESISQHGVRQAIPVSRLVVYVNEREGGNWAGQSLIRPAYKNWLLKDRELRSQALTIERNGLGVPVYTAAAAPADVLGGDRETWEKSEKEAGLDVATNFRAGDAAGASIPAGAKLELKGVEGDLPETDKPIRYHDEQIARAVLAHFLNLGTETGSWALGSTFAKFFTDSLNAVAFQVADTFNQHVIEDLVDANWGADEPAPRLVFETIGADHPPTADAIKYLIESNALTPDDPLEDYLRALYGLPVKDLRTSRPTKTGTP